MLQMDVQTPYLLLPITQLIGLRAANGNPNLAFVTPLTQLLRSHVVNGGPNLVFSHPLIQFDGRHLSLN